MKQLYKNTRAGRVRFLQVLFWAVTLGSAALAATGFSEGAEPNAWVVGVILTALFGACALGMEWYLRCYVTALHAAPKGLQLETLSTFGNARALVPWADVETAGDLTERTSGGDGPSIDNSSSLLRIRGRKMLIVDTTADRFDSAGLQSARRKALKG